MLYLFCKIAGLTEACPRTEISAKWGLAWQGMVSKWASIFVPPFISRSELIYAFEVKM